MRRALLPAVLVALLLAPAASAWTWPAGGPVLQPFLFDPGPSVCRRPAPGHRRRRRRRLAGRSRRRREPSPSPARSRRRGRASRSRRRTGTRSRSRISARSPWPGTRPSPKGAPVGTIGPSGDAEVAQPYVHLGVRLTAQEQGYLDPLTLLPAARRRAAGRSGACAQPGSCARAGARAARRPAPVAAAGARRRPLRPAPAAAASRAGRSPRRPGRCSTRRDRGGCSERPVDGRRAAWRPAHASSPSAAARRTGAAARAPA